MAGAEPAVPPCFEGYNLVANVMSQYPDFAIHPRFMALHHADLILQEAEIVCILDELKDIMHEDMHSRDENVRGLNEDLSTLIASSKTAHEDSQWTKRMELRCKLKAFGDHLLQVHALLRLPDVNQKDVNTFRTWLSHDRGANNHRGWPEDLIWKTSPEHDLSSLNGRHVEQDTVTRLIKSKLMSWLYIHGLHKFKDNFVTVYDFFSGASINTPLDNYSDRAIDRVVAVLSTTMSSLLPTISIFVLYFVHNQLVRLGLILVFTVLFSIIVMALTNAKRSECFAAAAAFSAIQVVFVSGSLPVSSST